MKTQKVITTRDRVLSDWNAIMMNEKHCFTGAMEVLEAMLGSNYLAIMKSELGWMMLILAEKYVLLGRHCRGVVIG